MDAWVFVVVAGINLVLLAVSLVVEGWALIHCALQRVDAFAAVGTLSKPVWLLLLGGTLLLTVLVSCGAGGPGSLLALIALTAALVYLLDIRPAIREISGGKSF